MRLCKIKKPRPPTTLKSGLFLLYVKTVVTYPTLLTPTVNLMIGHPLRKERGSVLLQLMRESPYINRRSSTSLTNYTYSVSDLVSVCQLLNENNFDDTLQSIVKNYFHLGVDKRKQIRYAVKV